MSATRFDELRAPDVAGTVDAWRVWRLVVEDGRHVLGSIIKPTLWPPGRALRAECLNARPPLDWLRRKERHLAPEERCECGVYAAGLDQIAQYVDEVSMRPAVAHVVGLVSLWGTVIECERGFRASSAYPARIYIPTDAPGKAGCEAEELVEHLGAYGVPVKLLDARCAEAPRVLSRQAA